MYMQLKEIEPCNISKTSDADGQKFFKRLSGRESFDWEGSVKPKCMLLDCIIYKESRGLNTVTGHLMSITVDKFMQMNDLGISVEGILEEHKIGWIQIDYRTEENTPNVSIKAHSSISNFSASVNSSNSYEEFGRMKTMGTPVSFQPSAVSTPNHYGEKTGSESNVSPSGGSMKFIILGVVVIALVIGGYNLINSKPVAPQPITYLIAKEANLRSSPSKGKNIIATLPKGSRVTAIENNGEWLKVRFNNAEGYIKSNLASTTQP